MSKWELVRNHLEVKDEDYPVLILDNENNRGESWCTCKYAKDGTLLSVVKGLVYKTVINDNLLVISTKEVDVNKSTKNIISFKDGTLVYFDPGFWLDFIVNLECADLFRGAYLHGVHPDIKDYISRDECTDDEEFESYWWDAVHRKYQDYEIEADELLQLNDILDEVKIILE